MKKIFLVIAIMIAFVSCTPKSTNNTINTTDSVVVDSATVETVDTMVMDTTSVK